MVFDLLTMGPAEADGTHRVWAERKHEAIVFAFDQPERTDTPFSVTCRRHVAEYLEFDRPGKTDAVLGNIRVVLFDVEFELYQNVYTI
jgi:hypothetical protein